MPRVFLGTMWLLLMVVAIGHAAQQQPQGQEPPPQQPPQQGDEQQPQSQPSQSAQQSAEPASRGASAQFPWLTWVMILATAVLVGVLLIATASRLTPSVDRVERIEHHEHHDDIRRAA